MFIYFLTIRNNETNKPFRFDNSFSFLFCISCTVTIKPQLSNGSYILISKILMQHVNRLKSIIFFYIYKLGKYTVQHLRSRRKIRVFSIYNKCYKHVGKIMLRVVIETSVYNVRPRDYILAAGKAFFVFFNAYNSIGIHISQTSVAMYKNVNSFAINNYASLYINQ